MATLSALKLELDDLLGGSFTYSFPGRTEDYDFSIMSHTGYKHNTSLIERSKQCVLDTKIK